MKIEDFFHYLKEIAMSERKQRVSVKLPTDMKLVKPRKGETPPVASSRGRGVSEVQQNLRNMVADLTHGEWFKIPIEGEAEQRSLISHLRNAVKATHDMGCGISQDEGHVWFRIQPKSNRGRKPKAETAS